MDIEEIIRRAQSEGKFNDLPGKGKPLDLANRGPQDLVMGVVKEAGFIPGWAAVGKDLDAGEETIERLRDGWSRRRAILLAEAELLLRRGDSASARRTLLQMRGERDAVARDLTLRWSRDRRATERYNLLVPSRSQQRALPSPARLLSAFLDSSPDAALSTDAPPRVVDVPATLDAVALASEAWEAVVAEEGGRVPRMNGARAEAVIGFKSKLGVRVR